MTLIGAAVLRDLNNKELRVLQGIEVGMRHSEYVEIDTIAKYANYPVPETERWLKKCHQKDLVHRWSGHFVGYELTIHGYDALALNALYMKEEIVSIGREKGVGKEMKLFLNYIGLDIHLFNMFERREDILQIRVICLNSMHRDCRLKLKRTGYKKQQL